MQILFYKNQRLTRLQLYSTTAYTEEWIFGQLEEIAQCTNNILLDFSGENIPICREDFPLCARLVMAHHNSLIRQNLNDDTYEPYETPVEKTIEIESSSDESTDPDDGLMNETLFVEFGELGYECRTGGGSIRAW